MVFRSRTKRRNFGLAGALIGLMLQASPAQADGYFQWQINSFGGGFTPHGPTDYLYDNGTPNKNVFMGQFEHFDQNRFGSNWIDFENYHGADMSGDPSKHDNYVLFVNPRLSIGKILNKNLSYGVFQDVSLPRALKNPTTPSSGSSLTDFSRISICRASTTSRPTLTRAKRHMWEPKTPAPISFTGFSSS
ncbi:hypothetical protein [Paraburkholderia sp. MM5477-R1]|uniref:hypothetical protein n=1 Tax=Paraburkholderia sp. MM5477-R1 TaxID=2991062 RepID=UPI003D21F577